MRNEFGQFIKGSKPKNGFKKGVKPWNKGKKLSLETKQKVSKSLKQKWGDTHYRNNMSIKHTGKTREQASNWKGGSLKWRKQQALIRDNYTCQICGLRDIEIMQIDHIKPQSIFPELSLEMNNLMTLCPNCHARKTVREKKQGYKIINNLTIA